MKKKKVVIITKEIKFSGIYEELLLLLDNEESVHKIYQRYNGMTISFPKKIYCQAYVEEYICKNYGIESIQDISRHVNLSSRRVMQIAQKNGLTNNKRNTE